MTLFDQTLGVNQTLGAPTSLRPGVLHYPRLVAETVEVLIVGEAVPEYAHPGDAGAEWVRGDPATVGTGVSIALPDGFAALVVPRSGLAARHGITIVNSPGTVDAGYRGEIRVTLLNTDSTMTYSVAVGDRIAQLLVTQVSRARFIPVETLPGSHRGTSGFGSTGYRGNSSGVQV
jgi:dUTP pyrophosphatase